MKLRHIWALFVAPTFRLSESPNQVEKGWRWRWRWKPSARRTEVVNQHSPTQGKTPPEELRGMQSLTQIISFLPDEAKCH